MNFDYTVRKELKAARHVAARFAVFLPLFGDEWLAKPAEIPLRLLRTMWHKRIDRLKKLKRSLTSTTKKVNYLRNCPPFGVATPDYACSCKLPFCPFCFARLKITEPFRAFEPLFRKRHDYSVVGFRATLRVKFEDVLRPLIIANRKTEINAYKPLGAYVLHQISPFRVKKNDYDYNFTRAGVMIFKPEDLDKIKVANPPTANSATVVEQRNLKTPNLSQLASLFGWAFRYHHKLLTTPAALMMEMFDSVRNVKMMAEYGILRSNLRSKDGQEGRADTDDA